MHTQMSINAITHPGNRYVHIYPVKAGFILILITNFVTNTNPHANPHANPHYKSSLAILILLRTHKLRRL